MQEKILILDFGSQYTQLIARSVRELKVYCEIQPCFKPVESDPGLKGIILSGSPYSVNDIQAPKLDLEGLASRVPVLGICYGAQLMAQGAGGTVAASRNREYGRAFIRHNPEGDPLWEGISQNTQVWMSHADTIMELPSFFEVIGHTSDIPIAAFRDLTRYAHPLYGLQFHPEVTHTTEGKALLKNFLVHICGCSQSWTAAAFVTQTVDQIRELAPQAQVIMALSGGVDSTVAARLIQMAVGTRLHGVFVDNGLLRKNEFRDVLNAYQHMGLNITGVDARESFYKGLKGKTDPEEKRKTIGRLFIEVFQQQAALLPAVSFLGQGTIYPDVIESVSVNGPSATIKSHHNVGGLPQSLHLTLIEPLRYLFKDEVRRIGAEIGVDPAILNRHPFPGPGLAIRILGEVTPQRVELLQQADELFIGALNEQGLYGQVWQAGTILLPIQSVGVMGDERTYENTIALRAVTSSDGMTADWARLPYEFLAGVSADIINKVKGINRVVYDISSKPPATIEWE